MRAAFGAPRGAAEGLEAIERERGDVRAMIADVWGRIDFIAVGVVALAVGWVVFVAPWRS